MVDDFNVDMMSVRALAASADGAEILARTYDQEYNYVTLDGINDPFPDLEKDGHIDLTMRVLYKGSGDRNDLICTRGIATGSVGLKPPLGIYLRRAKPIFDRLLPP